MFRCLAPTAFALLLAFCHAGCKRSPSGSADPSGAAANGPSDQFLGLMNAGKNYLDQGDAKNALAIYQKAAAIAPNDEDLHLNLANSYLVGGMANDAIREAEEVLKLEPNSAPAYFIKGSAYLRLSNWEEAAKALENVKKIDPGASATFFQLGRARMGLKQWDEAIAAFQAGIRMEPNRLHAAAHYLLGQSLVRAGRQDEAARGASTAPGQTPSEEASRRSVTSRSSAAGSPRPGCRSNSSSRRSAGIKIRFVDATKEVLGDASAGISPVRSG